ncbi:MAG: hypothetical protein SFY80_02230 [Verrucomicrobiota bacterium]|nr:hypothetical protein [Verrucomicrobiota bacterium]
MRYHDFKLRSYTVSDMGRKIELHLVYDYPGATEIDSHIEFTDVVCYHFVHTEGTILTDIDEEPLRDFVKNEEGFLASSATQNGLRLWRTDSTDYLHRLEDGGYHAWRLGSAIGFSGFVVARTVGEKEEPNQSAQTRSLTRPV